MNPETLHRQEPEEKPRHWRIEDIAYDAIDPSQVAGDEVLFYALAIASFIETGSDTYAHNLVAHYADRPEVAQWLSVHWEPEELQHGRALGRYVQKVWPWFQWQAAYNSFFTEYARLCTVGALYDDALEMAARCVVEMGTTTYYQALHRLAEGAGEPVLIGLLERIRADEVGHYKHFLGYFKALKTQRPVSRWRVARVLGARLMELHESDSDVALRHVWLHVHQASADFFPGGAASFDQLRQRLFERVSQRLPIQQAARMTLRPLLLPHRVEGWLAGPLIWLARRTMAAGA